MGKLLHAPINLVNLANRLQQSSLTLQTNDLGFSKQMHQKALQTLINLKLLANVMNTTYIAQVIKFQFTLRL